MIFSSSLLFISTLVFAGDALAQTEHLLKVATLAPEGSSWVESVRAIDEEIRRETYGAVGFKIYPGGIQGDEMVVLRKIRIGQLHGGGFGGQGISQIFPDILALEMPFLFRNYSEVDYVLKNMDTYYREGYEKKGFTFLGWADIGFVHILSKQPIRTVEDIRDSKVWQLTDEPITSVLFRLAGVKSLPLAIPDVLLGLQTNLIDVVYASPSAAIILQWFTRVNYITQLPINYTLGALLIDRRSFAKISPSDQELIRSIARTHMAELGRQSRQTNREAMEVLQANGLTLVDASPDDVQTFKNLVESAEAELSGNAFSLGAYQQIQEHLRVFRQTAAP